jgi:hypothetical protein
MDWQFGHNCAHLLPALDKCRIKVERYNQRADLLANRVLKTREILAYTQWSPQELLDRIERGDVPAWKVKKPLNPDRDGYVRYKLNCSWEWDSCGMAVTGGVCEWYEPTDAPHISCIADLAHWDVSHPNLAAAPSDEDWRQVDDALRGVVEEMTAAEAEEAADFRGTVT